MLILSIECVKPIMTIEEKNGKKQNLTVNGIAGFFLTLQPSTTGLKSDPQELRKLPHVN